MSKRVDRCSNTFDPHSVIGVDPSLSLLCSFLSSASMMPPLINFITRIVPCIVSLVYLIEKKCIIYYNLFPSVLLKLNSVIVEGSLPSLVVTWKIKWLEWVVWYDVSIHLFHILFLCIYDIAHDWFQCAAESGPLSLSYLSNREMNVF